jgi:hypothetical protein
LQSSVDAAELSESEVEAEVEAEADVAVEELELPALVDDIEPALADVELDPAEDDEVDAPSLSPVVAGVTTQARVRTPQARSPRGEGARTTW